MVRAYFGALWHQWQVLLTGGTVMALVVLFSFTTGKQVSQPWAWGILAATFVAASFGAWREERKRADSMTDTKKKAESRRAIRAQIATHLTEAGQFQNILVNKQDEPPPLDAIQAWLNTVQLFLRTHLDSGWELRFLTGTADGPRKAHAEITSAEHQKYWSIVFMLKQTLTEFLKELPPLD